MDKLTTPANLPALVEQAKEAYDVALHNAKLVKDTYLKTFPSGVNSSAEDETAKGFLQTASMLHDERKAERMELTKILDNFKKEQMQPEKDMQEIIIQLQKGRDLYANKVQQKLEIDNYRQQFGTRLAASIKVLATQHASLGIKGKVEVKKVIEKPWQQHLQHVWAELCDSSQPEAEKMYSELYAVAPKGEQAKAEVETTKAVAQMELGMLESQKLDFKPKGSRKAIEVSVTHVDGLKRLFGLYFESMGAGILSDKNCDFVKKWAAKNVAPEELSKLTGVSVIESIKTRKA